MSPSPPPAVRLRRALERADQVRVELVEAFNAVWRRSLQLRVVISTLALSSAVVLVLGFVIQTQIGDSILQTKQRDAQLQLDAGGLILERDLSGVDPAREGAQGDVNNALDRLTNAGGGEPAAGAFRAVLTGPGAGEVPVTVGRLELVPADLRAVVGGETDRVASKFHSVVDGGDGALVKTLIIGKPVRTAGSDLQFYLLFPLTAEERTLGLVQSTLVVGGLILLLLLTGIASIITRQVVRPVQQAAHIAERFADGHLDERMPVIGEDEVARLGESYNEMASSIQHQIRQLEEFGALQRRFTSDVSHELRTPLTTVRMAADVLYASRDDLVPALGRSSELLVAELDRFEALLADLLEISKLDAGVADLGAEQVDVGGVVERAVEAVRGIAEETATPLELDLPDGVHAEIDPRRVERIVRNLVANAVDHGEGRPVQVVLRADPDAVAVLVRDHGVGLRPGEAALVFNRFWRAEESRARRTGGSGLGLSIAVEDARLHGGWLQAWGEVGHGSAFRLTLPRVAGATLISSPLPLGPHGDEAHGASVPVAGASGPATGPLPRLGADDPGSVAQEHGLAAGSSPASGWGR